MQIKLTTIGRKSGRDRTAALPAWGDGHVLDPHLVGPQLELEDANQLTVQLEHPDLVLADRVRVVDEHRHRRATDQGFVVSIGGNHELGDRLGIGVSGAS